MTVELGGIENLLVIIAATLLWLAVAQTLFLGAIYFKLRNLLFSREHKQGNGYKETNSIHNRVENNEKDLVSK